jgi:endonuclease/exonuclease/phosphatase family metal-dependent hydrolase
LADDVSYCREVLGKQRVPNYDRLDSGAIRLVNWNVRKGSTPEWWDDLEPMLQANHLALFQEAAFNERMLDSGGDRPFFSFAPGFATGRATTGVVTFSRIAPLAHCNLSVREPWLGTPKATGITEFGLSGSETTLVVVNIHAINFAIGLADFEAQLAGVFDAVGDHRGPLIVSGDFNTWRRGRTQALTRWTESFGLRAVEYRTDHRVRKFGQHLDQIYVRALTVVESSTEAETSSDHNPMYVTLQI